MRLETKLKLRDALLMAADALTEDIEADAPPEIKNETEQLSYSISKINTEPAEGPNGPYKKATADKNQNNSDFEALFKDLEEHNGKLTKDGLFCWLFGQASQKTLGIKPSRR